MKALYILLSTLLLLTFAACSNQTSQTPPTEDEIVEEAPPEPNVVEFVFVGDLMTHPFLVERVEAEYKVLMHMSNYYMTRDVSFANLEFTVNTNKPAMPYPNFNGTYDYLKYFSEFFNTWSVANNHAYDQGPRAQTETMGFLADFGDLALGGSTNDQNIAPTITNINGIDIYLAAYSSLDNGLAKMNLRRGEYVYYMNFYPDYKEMLAKVQADLMLANDEMLKIASLHYGMEYTTNARPVDIKLMRDMIESGVDIVVAHHAHVVRPTEYYEGTNHSGVIIHSLGNFLANHKSKYDYLDIGATVFLTVEEDAEKNRTYDYDYLATYIYYYNTPQGRDARIIPIAEDPEIHGLPFDDLYEYTSIDTKKIKDGYKLIDIFFSPLTNVK